MKGGDFTGSSSSFGPGPSFTIEGGVGSIRWTMTEIVASSAGLARTAELMDPLLDRMKSERLWLSQACTGARSIPSGMFDAMVRAEWRCGAVQGILTELARHSGQAAENYAAAEAASANAIAALSRLTALRNGWLTWASGPLAPLKSAVDFTKWLEQMRRDGVRNAAEAAARDGGAYVAGALGPSISLMYVLTHLRHRDALTTGRASAFLLRKTLDHTQLTRPGTLSVRAVPPQEWSTTHSTATSGPAAQGYPWKVDATFESLLQGSNDAYAYPPGSIAVVQIQRPDGSNAWVVHLPGTEDWSTVDSSNPFDMEGNLEALTAAQQAQFKQQEVMIQELIKAALQSAGALPGEDVLLTGHSGGGIHAAAAAASPAFLAEVKVRMILIAGAPAGNAAVQEGVTVLGLENDQDLVTAADFHAPPTHKNWVTVTSHRPPVTGGALDVLEQAHSMENYLLDAAKLDQSQDPAVRAAKESLERILGVTAVGAGIAGHKWVFQGKDNDKPPQRPVPPQRPLPSRPAPIPGKDYVRGGR